MLMYLGFVKSGAFVMRRVVFYPDIARMHLAEYDQGGFFILCIGPMTGRRVLNIVNQDCPASAYTATSVSNFFELTFI